MSWQYVNDKRLANYFEGENIWSKEWKPIGKEIVIDPHYGKEINAEIWETQIKDMIKSFIAIEVSSGCWIFFLPSDR